MSKLCSSQDFMRAERLYQEYVALQPEASSKKYGITVPQGKPISLKTYEKAYSYEEEQRIGQRLEQVDAYFENNRDETGLEILYDIILQTQFSKEAARAAFMLALYFEQGTNSKQKSIAYYSYVINDHFNSVYGIDALSRLAFLLQKLEYASESEALLLYLLKRYEKHFKYSEKKRVAWAEDAANLELYTMAKKSLKEKYYGLSKWYFYNAMRKKACQFYRKAEGFK